jgi:hypothetical protein
LVLLLENLCLVGNSGENEKRQTTSEMSAIDHNLEKGYAEKEVDNVSDGSRDKVTVATEETAQRAAERGQYATDK